MHRPAHWLASVRWYEVTPMAWCRISVIATAALVVMVLARCAT